jgi:hypothetical protein
MHDRTNPSPVRVVSPAAKHGPVAEWELVRTQVSSTQWDTSTQDPDRGVADLNGQFPSATMRFDEYTGSYWAFVGRPRLIEASTPTDLSWQLAFFDPCMSPLLSPHTPHDDTTTRYSEPEAGPRSLRRPRRGCDGLSGRHSTIPNGSGRC